MEIFLRRNAHLKRLNGNSQCSNTLLGLCCSCQHAVAMSETAAEVIEGHECVGRRTCLGGLVLVLSCPLTVLREWGEL